MHGVLVMLNVGKPWSEAEERMLSGTWWQEAFGNVCPDSLDFDATQEWDQQCEWVTGMSYRAGIDGCLKPRIALNAAASAGPQASGSGW